MTNLEIGDRPHMIQAEFENGIEDENENNNHIYVTQVCKTYVRP